MAFVTTCPLLRRIVPFSRRTACVTAMALGGAVWLGAQVPETVGRIEGHDVAVRGQMSVERHGERNTTLLLSGSEVTVRSGYARILLEGGGELAACGPAQFSLLKSGGSLMVAVSAGRLRARVDAATPVSFYAAFLTATPVAIGGGPRDVVLGIEANGGACVLAARGAVRLEQQLTGMSLVVPERAEVLLPDGQLESLAESQGACRCEAPVTAAPPEPRPAVRQPEVAIGAARTTSPEPREEKPPPKAAPEDQPVWRVVMPPLTFDAASPEPPPELRPEIFLLVREARVRGGVVFRGRVEPREAPPARIASRRTPGETPEASPPARARAESGVKQEEKGIGAAVKRFFGRLFGRKG